MSSRKYYNPYPFPVRVLDDRGDIYTLAPQDYCKVLNGEYTQSLLDLQPVSEERTYYPGLNFELDKIVKKDLIPLAWALGIDDVDGRTKKEDIIKKIEGVVGE